jgi:hypothetical protein
MYRNEILEEIHQHRNEYAQSFQYDLRAIFNDLKRKEFAHKDKLIKLRIKRQATAKKD